MSVVQYWTISIGNLNARENGSKYKSYESFANIFCIKVLCFFLRLTLKFDRYNY